MHYTHYKIDKTFYVAHKFAHKKQNFHNMNERTGKELCKLEGANLIINVTHVCINGPIALLWDKNVIIYSHQCFFQMKVAAGCESLRHNLFTNMPLKICKDMLTRNWIANVLLFAYDVIYIFLWMAAINVIKLVIHLMFHFKK